MKNKDKIFQVACCLHSTASEILAECGLRVPERGHPTHKGGGDYECENCESLWVWPGDSAPGESGFNDSKCVKPLTREFVVELAYPVCTENLDPCKNYDDKCQTDADSGCYEADPAIGDGKCGNSSPTVLQESAYLWRARYALETELGCRLSCCLLECAGLRCGGIQVLAVSQTVEGGCSYTTITLAVEW